MSDGRYSLDYVKRVYGVPAKRGMRVVADGKSGVITSGDGAHIRIRLDGEKHSGCWHPTWNIDYGDGIDHGARMDARIEDFNDMLNRRGRYAEARPSAADNSSPNPAVGDNPNPSAAARLSKEDE